MANIWFPKLLLSIYTQYSEASQETFSLEMFKSLKLSDHSKKTKMDERKKNHSLFLEGLVPKTPLNQLMKERKNTKY